MDRLLKRKLTEVKRKKWFEAEGYIRDRVIEDAVGAIQLIVKTTMINQASQDVNGGDDDGDDDIYCKDSYGCEGYDL